MSTVPSDSSAALTAAPLAQAGFGACLTGPGTASAAALLAAGASDGKLAAMLDAADGFLLVKGLVDLRDDPGLLVRLSTLFGPVVEDYTETTMARNRIHRDHPEIFVVSNGPPANRQPPPPPTPPLTEDGAFPVTFPQRSGWHTDQSYRRPPPDISLFYCVEPAPKGSGQTLYANGVAAYRSLPDDLKAAVANLIGIHAQPGTGRSESAVRAGQTPDPTGSHNHPQRQPVVRHHPVTGRPALYLCERGQMDWVDGPFVGMTPGVDGDGARLLYRLMAHYTAPAHVYCHDWDVGDLVIYDNRSLIHAATWFDAAAHVRVMWRTTVWGNPGPEYAGEAKSWRATAPSAR